jgi:hypothetical protein
MSETVTVNWDEVDTIRLDKNGHDWPDIRQGKYFYLSLMSYGVGTELIKHWEVEL